MEEKNMLIRSPYVVQADRFAMSLKRMADTFLKLEQTKENLNQQEIEEMYEKIVDRVCTKCDRRKECYEKNQEEINRLIYEILETIESYGTELNVETKRNLQRKCVRAPKLLRETLEAFQNQKQMMIWNNKIVENREGCARQLDSFAEVIRQATRELEESIFNDSPLERKIRGQLRKTGIKVLQVLFFMNEDGRYEIHITMKAEKGICVTTRTIARLLTHCSGRRMCAAEDERPVVGQEYSTLVFVEGPKYYTLQGIAKIGKGCQKISGDSFLMTRLPGGQEAMILSDGMGAGEAASKESSMIIEMLEELLRAGFPKETALSMMNTALVMGREEVKFSTIDMACFDLYMGTCKFYKAGAATTFIRGADGMEHVCSESLPLGVVHRQKTEMAQRRLESGDIVVMVSDGVLDALPEGRQEELLDLIIGGTSLENPKELAHYILEKVLELTSGEPKDDMTILVAGIWKI